jgi:hypothetical protein
MSMIAFDAEQFKIVADDYDENPTNSRAHTAAQRLGAALDEIARLKREAECLREHL